jgi:putative membrane protein
VSPCWRNRRSRSSSPYAAPTDSVPSSTRAAISTRSSSGTGSTRITAIGSAACSSTRPICRQRQSASVRSCRTQPCSSGGSRPPTAYRTHWIADGRALTLPSLPENYAARVREQPGAEPDARFTLANERTFLAWIRTALALVAGGIGLEAFVPRLAVPGLRQVLAVSLVLLGSAVSAGAYGRWVRVERALRLGEPLPPSRLAPVLAYGIAAVALVTVVLLVVEQA